jgi:hypothetical protein
MKRRKVIVTVKIDVAAVIFAVATLLIPTRSDVDSSPHVYGIDNARFCYRQESQRQRGLV